MASVGMNLAAINYWSTEYPFLDRMKSAGAWTVQGTNAGALTLDANGYPVAMPTGDARIYTMISVDPASANTTNVYELTYTGAATFKIAGATILSNSDGKLVFQYNGTSTMAQIIVTSITSPITEMHVVRQDQVDLFNQGEIFNPAFLDKVSGFDTLRFMDWGATNGSTITSWSDRTTVSDMSWASTTQNGSVPIEVMVALANKTHSAMWINIPAEASDDFVRQEMQYIKDNLDPSLKVNVEYSNEVWNWGFAQSKYALATANALWGKDVNGDGVIDPNNTAENVQGGFMIYYGYRSAQIAAITQSVFGTDAASRLTNVLSTQTSYPGLEGYIFQGIAKANLGTAGALFDDYAVTTYFGTDLNGGTAADRATILSWARSGSAGLDAAFKELQSGGTLSTTGSLQALAALYVYQKQVADKYGLNLVAYEGGLALAASAFSADVQPEIMAFFANLQADPRMGDLYTKMIADFTAAGGSLLNVYTDAQSDRAGGLFGTLDSIYDTNSPAYAALLAATQASTGGATTTALSSYTLDSTSNDVTYTGKAAFTANGTAAANVITGGDAGNTLYGNAGNDTLTGGNGNDYLDGGTGMDTLTGGLGNDVYVVDNIGDVVVESASGGVDEVRTTLAAYTLGSNVENLTYTGSTMFTGTGNALANVITGGAAANTLYGADGADTLIGGAASDYLDGGTGADKMTGGAGNDVYIVDNVGDVVTEAANGGTDEVRTTLAAYTLGANVENLTYLGSTAFAGTGNTLANVIVGGNGNDYIDGGTGADKMTGGAGNDVYIVDNAGDVVTEIANGGTDEVRTTLAAYTLGNNVENLSYLGSSAFTGTGNALANVITGGSGNSILYGGDGNDSLIGGNGNDYLDGGSGNDKMAGGAGNDIYIVDSVSDIVTEGVNGGIDEVRTASSLGSLSANVENLTFTGSGDFMGIGNALNNVIKGGAGANRLSGGDGNDTLIGGSAADTLDGGTGIDSMSGGLGNDAYFVDNVADVVVEGVNGGTDSVYSTVSYTLSANVENLRLSASDAVNATGNELANTLTGNAAVNRLLGLAGNDLIMAGDGDDYLDGGTGDDTLLGEAGNDYILGGDGNDTLNGGAGNDVLVGAAGKDNETGGAGADRFVFNAGDLSALPGSTDVIYDFARSEGDKIDVSGMDAITGTSGDDIFRFVGAGAFTKQAGELRVDTYGGYWNVMGDTNGDGVADFSLLVSKQSGGLIASDFVL